MFILLSGYPPFGGDSEEEVLRRVAAGKFEFDSKLAYFIFYRKFVERDFARSQRIDQQNAHYRPKKEDLSRRGL